MKSAYMLHELYCEKFYLEHNKEDSEINWNKYLALDKVTSQIAKLIY